MKQKARKILSLLLALVMVCGMMSTAWAEGETGTITWGSDGKVTNCTHAPDSGSVTTAATCTTTGVMTYHCTATGAGTDGENATCGATGTATIPVLGHDFASTWTAGTTTHYHACNRSGCTVKETEATHTYPKGV